MRLHHAVVPLLITLTTIAGLLSGCASLATVSSECVRIGPAGTACLLPPNALPASRSSHIVTIRHDGDERAFLGRLSINDNMLRLATVSLAGGAHLFTLTWDGRKATLQPQRDGIRPKRFLAILQAAIAPPDRLQSHLHGLKLHVSHTADGSDIRTLTEHGRLVARIRRSGQPLADARLTIHIPPADLRIRLEPVSPS